METGSTHFNQKDDHPTVPPTPSTLEGRRTNLGERRFDTPPEDPPVAPYRWRGRVRRKGKTGEGLGRTRTKEESRIKSRSTVENGSTLGYFHIPR